MGDECRTKAIEFRTNRLQNTYLTCHQAEKTLQLIRLLLKQTREDESAKFIVYFATCAAVDYFYNVSLTRVSTHGQQVYRDSLLADHRFSNGCHLSPSSISVHSTVTSSPTFEQTPSHRSRHIRRFQQALPSCSVPTLRQGVLIFPMLTS